MNIILKPFIWLAGWLVMRDLKKWARIPYIFDATANQQRLTMLLKEIEERRGS